MYRRVLAIANTKSKSQAVGSHALLTRTTNPEFLRPHLHSQLQTRQQLWTSVSTIRSSRGFSTTRRNDSDKFNQPQPQPIPPNLSKKKLSNLQYLCVATLCGTLFALGLDAVNDYFDIADDDEDNLEDEDKNVLTQDLEAIFVLQTMFDREDAEIVTTDEYILSNHGFSAEGIMHGVVVFPRSTEDVAKIVKVAVKYRMPVFTHFGDMDTEDIQHNVGICVDLSKMNEVLEIHEADSDLVCQPAAKWADINESLKNKGIPLFFPLDSYSEDTIGGILNTGSIGANAVGYGTPKSEWFLNATVVLPSGEIIKTRRRSRKSAAGFDTTKLFIGAEGTLGIITEVTIRLAPVVPTTVALAHFPDLEKAREALVEVASQGIGIQSVEIVDHESISSLKQLQVGHSSCIYKSADHLIFKLRGPIESSLKETSSIVQKIVEKYGGKGFELARSKEEAEVMWNETLKYVVLDAKAKQDLRQELGDETVEFMRLIKNSVDPLGLFNPGRLYAGLKPLNKTIKGEESS